MLSLPEFLQNAQKASLISARTGTPLNDVVRGIALEQEEKKEKDKATTLAQLADAIAAAKPEIDRLL